MREQIAAIRSATNAEQAIQLGIQEQETASKLAERLIMSVSAVENRVAALEGTATQAMATIQATVQATAAQATPIERKRKSLGESNCIGNMRTLGSDKADFRMWNGTGFIYDRQFNQILLDLMPPNLRSFYQEYVIQDPDNPDIDSEHPIFRAIDSYVISLMTKNHRDIVKKLRFSTFSEFLATMSSMLDQDPEFVFMTINRDGQGRRKIFPHAPLPGAPALRILWDLEDPVNAMSAADWGLTPVRFLLDFRPFIQEYYSNDSGIDDQT